MALRVEQYGWSPPRIVALAVVVAVAWHAVGYMVAVIRSGAALRDLPMTNVVSAAGIIALMIALMTPLADPARLSVADQVGRLQAGRISLEKFDFALLNRGSGRYGEEALARLKSSASAADAARIEELANAAIPEDARPPQATEATRRANIKMMRPATATLPAEFLGGDWNNFKQSFRLPSCLTLASQSCEGSSSI